MTIFRCTGVVVQDSAAHWNAGFFPPVVIFGYVSCTFLLLILFGLLVVPALSVFVGAGTTMMGDQHTAELLLIRGVPNLPKLCYSSYFSIFTRTRSFEH
jgi:hypothetical protein